MTNFRVSHAFNPTLNLLLKLRILSLFSVKHTQLINAIQSSSCVAVLLLPTPSINMGRHPNQRARIEFQLTTNKTWAQRWRRKCDSQSSFDFKWERLQACYAFSPFSQTWYGRPDCDAVVVFWLDLTGWWSMKRNIGNVWLFCTQRTIDIIEMILIALFRAENVTTYFTKSSRSECYVIR